MKRCRWCRADTLDVVEYVERDLFGVEVRVVIIFCETCGNAEQSRSWAVPVPA